MTTVQTMPRTGSTLRTLALALATAVGALALVTLAAACSGKPDLVPPEALLSPYDDSTGDVLWAVAPLANESGTSVVDALGMSDAIVAKITEVHGLAALPMNRTIAAMRSLSLSAVRSPSEARMLAESLGVDGLVVGSITAYDPYNPPTIGLTLALYTRPQPRAADLLEDPQALRSWPTERAQPRSTFADAPAVVISEQLPAINHAVQMDVRNYAQGRHQQGSALGWERYLASMDLYTDFAAYRAVRLLLDEERLRQARTPRAQIGPSR